MADLNSVTIARMKSADLPSVADLSAQLGYPIEMGLLSKQFEELSKNAEHYLGVASAAGRVLGFIHANKYLDLIEPHTVQIIALVVDENSRSLGIGARLVKSVEDWSRSIGIRNVWVRSNIKRDRAHAFYQRLGYPITKTSHKFSKIV